MVLRYPCILAALVSVLIANQNKGLNQIQSIFAQKLSEDQMLWGDNFFMKSKFVQLFQNQIFDFHMIIYIQLCSRLQEIMKLILEELL